MVVQHNMQAMNANRMLNITTGSQAKSTEKLSSGYRINRAADDAAGLTISEKMRKQMRGLDRASTNAQDGVSAVQTAEGALTEVHSMLQRMNELANQASNGSNSKSDRDAIQAEIEQLTTEIDRVAETTKFNETYLLKGNAAGTSSKMTVNAHDAGLAGTLTDNGDGTTTFKLNDALKVGDKVSIGGQEYKIGAGLSTDNYDTADNVNAKTLSAGDTFTKSGVTKTVTNNVAKASITAAHGDVFVDKSGESYTYIAKADNSSNANYSDNLKKDYSSLTKAGWVKTSVLAKGAAVDADVTTEVPDEGSKYTKYDTTAKALGTVTNDVVDHIGKLEVSTYNKTDLTVGTLSGNLGAGDSVTIGGVTTNVVDNDFTPTAFDTVKNAIQHLEGDKAVTIADIDGTGSKTYTVVESTDDPDHDSTHLTRDEIIAQIKEGNRVTVDAGGTEVKYTAAGVDTEDNTITAKTAYEKMAKELTAASSIGTDVAARVQNDGNGSFVITQGTVNVKDGLSFSLHVGADADMTNKINVDIESMSSAGLGIKGINVSDENGSAATYAIDAISDAIAKVSEQRSALGAVQNRLEHTIANLDNVVENTTSAESRIRDTDMASEMVEFSKNNILAQAGQSMLAQANQSNQGVLSLLG